MDDKVRINIQIAGTKHPLFVRPDDEPAARQAARLVTERYAVYATRYRGAALPETHLMALAAFDVALRYVRQDADSNAEQAAADIQAIVDDLHAYIG